MLPSAGLYGRSRNAALLSIALLAGYLLLAVFGWTLLKFIQHRLMSGVFGGPNRRIATSDLVAADLAVTWYVPILIVLAWWLVAMLLHKIIVQCLTGAESVTRAQEPRLFTIVENTVIAVGLPLPSIDVIETPSRNAYASGLFRDGSTITVTRGLLDALDDRELSAVVAHEVAHILNGDARVMLIATVFNGLVTLIAEFFWRWARWMTPTSKIGPILIMFGLLILGPLVMLLVIPFVAVALIVAVVVVAIACVFSFMRFAGLSIAAVISRLREHIADAEALEITHDVDGLISALGKISGHERISWLNAGMNGFMFADPSSGDLWLATHPSLAARVAAINALRSKYAARAHSMNAKVRSARKTARSSQPTVVFGRRA